MIKDVISRPVFIKCEPCLPQYKRLGSTTKVVDDRVVKSSIFEDFDIAGSISVYSSSDFSIDNILAVGAEDKMLRPMQVLSKGSIGMADQFDIDLSKPKNV